jgi:sulfur carrier protein
MKGDTTTGVTFLVAFFLKRGEIMVQINGEMKNAAGCLMKEYLLEEGYRMDTIAVELNKEILPKKEYANTLLKDNDVIEIINFVRGG